MSRPVTRSEEVHGVANHAEFMDKLVGHQHISEITVRATIKEGYGV